MAIKNQKAVENYYKTHLETLKDVALKFGVKYATITSWSHKGKWKKGENLAKNHADSVDSKDFIESNPPKTNKSKDIITLKRKTKETDIALSLRIYGRGIARIDSGVGFFNHMLEALSKHSLMDLDLRCKGDVFVDSHHSVEDCGIVLGNALKEGIYPAEGIERFGNGSVVMDEACVECDIDISNRAFLVFDMRAYKLPFKGSVGALDVELIEEFFRALVFNAGICAHIVLKRGKNLHHIIEAIFKAFALSLRRALAKNPRISLPSTKGAL